MSLQPYAPQSEFPFLDVDDLQSSRSAEHDAVVANLTAALEREKSLLRQLGELESRQALQMQELNHRLFNGLQSIASLLSAQSRQVSPEAAAQLTVAVSRIVAFGQVNRRLHLLDHQDTVEFSGYLAQLCADLSALLLWQHPGCAIAVEAAPLQLPTATAIPLSFIVNELITNAVKYAAGDITVRVEAQSPGRCILSVFDQGAGLPPGFDPGANKGLGMRIVGSLVAQIGGQLLIGPGRDGRGTCFAVRFALPGAKGA